jgi:hypothetical protein
VVIHETSGTGPPDFIPLRIKVTFLLICKGEFENVFYPSHLEDSERACDDSQQQQATFSMTIIKPSILME